MSTDAEMVRGQLAMGAIEAHRALDRLAAADERAETLADALRAIESNGCETFTVPWGCLNEPSRAVDAVFGADRRCYPCHSHAALAAVTPTEAAE